MRTKPDTSRYLIWTYDWVPEPSRGTVRDVRLRWACEEAGLPYAVRTVPFDERGADHFAHQPFSQTPFLQDGDVTLFESGACLLHLAEASELLMPSDPVGRTATLQWEVAAFNSIEMNTVPWWFIGSSKPAQNPLDGLLTSRPDDLEAILTERDWLAANRFTIADLLIADVLRLPWIRTFGCYPATAA